MEMYSKKPVRTATLVRAGIFPDPLLRGPVTAQKFDDFGMTTLLRETKRRLSIIGPGVPPRSSDFQGIAYSFALISFCCRSRAFEGISRSAPRNASLDMKFHQEADAAVAAGL